MLFYTKSIRAFTNIALFNLDVELIDYMDLPPAFP